MAMTTEKLRSAFLTCERTIVREADKKGITMAIRDPDAESKPRRVSHMLWMARIGLELIEQGRREKAMRWLGFLQGALWWGEFLSVEELKNMNRPDDSDHDPDRV